MLRMPEVVRELCLCISSAIALWIVRPLERALQRDRTLYA